jgi:heptosyltransferase II
VNILVVRLSAMGDVVLASSVLSYLRERFPDAATGLVTGAHLAALYESDPRVSHLYPYDKSDPTSLRSSAGNVTWDRVVDLQNNRRSRRLVALLAPAAACGRLAKLHLRRWLLLLLRLDCYPRGASVVTRYLEAAGWQPGQCPPPPATIHVSARAEAEAASLLGPHAPGALTLGLAPFSAWKNKQWPVERFAATARHFMAKGWRVVVFGGAEEAQEGEMLAAELGAGAISLAAKTSPAGSAAGLRRCSLVLGNDTGVSHLARAMGVKTTVVYGSTTRHFGFYPEGEPVFRVLEASAVCRPCHPHGGSRCWRGGRPCLTRVTTAAAIEALEGLHAGTARDAATSMGR